MANTVIQIPEISVEQKVRPEKIPGGGFIYAIRFKLPVKAEKDGYIIQHIVQEENGTQIDQKTKVKKSVFKRIEYWEAWEVKKGETSPKQSQSVRSFITEKKGKTPSHGDYDIPMNDIFYKHYAIGAKGSYSIWGLAGFYQEVLPPDFIPGNEETGAGGLLATTKKPDFWSLSGLLRNLRFSYDCETEEKANDDSKQNLDPEVPRIINASFADGWFK